MLEIYNEYYTIGNIIYNAFFLEGIKNKTHNHAIFKTFAENKWNFLTKL